jgi:hypothetical protein
MELGGTTDTAALLCRSAVMLGCERRWRVVLGFDELVEIIKVTIVV